MNPKIRIAAAILFALASLAVHAQSDPFARTFSRPAGATAPPAVQYIFPEQINVPAGKPTPVTLHFRIAPGLHINSNKPREEFLIPTTFSIPEGAGVELKDTTYPPGADFTLPIDPKTKLSVYTNEFAIQAHIVATPGNHLVEGKLHFQACDRNQCMPPKTIPVAIDVIAK